MLINVNIETTRDFYILIQITVKSSSIQVTRKESDKESVPDKNLIRVVDKTRVKSEQTDRMAASVMNYHGSSNLRLTGGITKSRTKIVSRLEMANPKKLKSARKMLFGPVDGDETRR